MTRTNVNKTKRLLESDDRTDTVDLDGDQTGAIFRAIVPPDQVDAFVDDLESLQDIDATVARTKYVGIGMEVTIR